VKPIDTSASLRLAVLMEMLEDVSRARGPEDALQAFMRRYRRVRSVDALVTLSVEGVRPGEFRITRSYRSASHGGAGTLVSALDAGGLPPAQTGGLLGRIVSKGEPQLYHELDPEADPHLGGVGGVGVGMGSCMAVPLFRRGAVTGWSLMFRADPRGYRLADLEDDLLVANLLGSMALNLESLLRIGALNEQLGRQFDEVARVQRALLPSGLPKVAGASFAASYVPNDRAGGDYYDFFDLGGGRVGVLIADVSGHGPASATVMAMLHAILHAFPGMADGPAAALRFANRQLAASSIEGGHVTAVFGVLDAGTRRLTLARAGHPLPRLRLPGGDVREIEGEAGPPLGIVADGYALPEHAVDLSPGQSVVLYTDGVTESENAKGEQFGTAGLDVAVSRSSSAPGAIVEAVGRALAEHSGARPHDDRTLVVFRVEA
jgi:sigma-B regulation protein RsbU (phosphoserine phosphatase)